MHGKILVTRPKERAKKFISSLEQENYSVFHEPMLVYQSVIFDEPDWAAYGAYIFTSTYAVEAFERLNFSEDVTLFCVGKETALALGKKGVKNSIVLAENGYKLYEKISKNKSYASKKFLHVRSGHASLDFRIMLKSQDIAADNLVVYDMVPRANLSAELIQNIKNREIEIITFFSMRTTKAFVNCIEKYDLSHYLSTISALCLSDAMLKYVHLHKWKDVQVTKTPDRDGMLSLVQSCMSE